jgi:hypothetical protein
MVEAIGTLLRSRAQTGSQKTVESVWKRVADSVYGIDKDVFTELLNGLWEGCGRTAKPNETTLRVWYFCLHDLTEQQLAHAIMKYLTERSSDFLSIQLIRELSGIQEAAVTAGLTAWSVAVKTVATVGSYAAPEFDDPVLSRTIESLGGWIWFCDQNPAVLRDFVRARFMKTYDSFTRSSVAQPARLIGLIEQSGGARNAVRIRMRDGSTEDTRFIS